MLNFLRKRLSEPPAMAPSGLTERIEKLEAALAEQHRRLLTVEGDEAVREAAHHARMDALARLYKRVSQRFVDSPELSPTPRAAEAESSVLELRRRLNK